MRLSGSIAVILLSVFLWRNGRTLKNVVAPVKTFPKEYFSEGDAQSSCRLIRSGGSGGLANLCEDAVFWNANGATSRGGMQKGGSRMIMLSCDPNRFDWNTVMGPMRNGTGMGSLWVYNPTAASGDLVQVTLKGFPAGNNSFHPLGVHILPSDPRQLLVVNHGVHRSTIEHFELTLEAPYLAAHLRTYAHPKLISPNSVAWTSPSSFYVTQDHRLTRRLPHVFGRTLPMLETLLLPGITELSHVTILPDDDNNNNNKSNNKKNNGDNNDEVKLHITSAARHLAFPNGVSMSPNGERVAVASSSEFIVHFYDRDPVSNRLAFNASVQVPMAPDNVHFADDKTLIVAGHPNFIALSAVAAGKKGVFAPSWILSMTARASRGSTSSTSSSSSSRPLIAGEVQDATAPVPVSRAAAGASSAFELKTLYQSDGSVFGSSTTALWDHATKTLYAVGLYQEGLMVCRRK